MDSTPRPDGSLAFHLHRFLGAFITQHNLGEVEVCCGFEGSAATPIAVKISAEEASPCPCDLDFEALARAWHQREDWTRPTALAIEGQTRVALAIPMPEEDAPQLLGLLIIPADSPPIVSVALAREAQGRVAEAIRAARRNHVRLLFDASTRSSKDFLYSLLEQLQQSCGVDHSAALLLARNLEGMTLGAPGAEFELVAERLFYRPDELDAPPERLVGLVVKGHGEEGGLIARALEQVEAQPETSLHVFVPNDVDDRERWHVFGEPDAQATRFATRCRRPLEGMTVLAPLLHRGDRGEVEVLGFLSINYRQPVPISALTGQLIEQLTRRLARRLRSSSMFTLSARQLLVIEGVRRLHDQSIGQGGARKRLLSFIGQASELIFSQADIPCVALAYLSTVGASSLRFVHPRGVTRFSELNVPLHSRAPDGTSIAALAARLQRPMVFAGADHERPSRNSVLIHEGLRRMVDARVVDPATLPDPDGWHPLSDYYRPSREQSYATLAFPIQLGGALLGVLVVEIDRDTDWLWWTGFGSQAFYRLLANELSIAFHLLGVPNL